MRGVQLYRNLIVSPHIDDAYYSLGGMISNYRGQRQKVIDVFSVSDYTILGRHYDAKAVVRMRKREELANAKRTMADVRFLDIPEATKRGYSRVRVQPDWGKEKATLARIRKALRSEAANCDNIFFPMGYKMHPDHIIVAKLGLELMKRRRNVYFYEDIHMPGSRPFVDPAAMKLEPRLIRCSIGEKIRLCTNYRSQLRTSELLWIIAYAFVRGHGGFAERIWGKTQALNIPSGATSRAA